MSVYVSLFINFYREEIQRLKAENPSMTHKEAFSTAAKNVGVPFSLLNHLTILISKHRNR